MQTTVKGPQKLLESVGMMRVPHFPLKLLGSMTKTQ